MKEIIKIKIDKNKRNKRKSRTYFSQCNMSTKIIKSKKHKKPKYKHKIYED